MCMVELDAPFPTDPTDHIFQTLPEIGLFWRIHTPEQREYLSKWCACPSCGKRPDTIEPLPEEWVWDCRAFTNWAWCPECI